MTKTRPPKARPRKARPTRRGSTVIGGMVLSWLVYLGLATLLGPVRAAYIAGAVLGVAVGLALPRARIVWSER